MKSLIKKLIAPVILATGLLFSPVKANPKSNLEKINSPEYAEEVITDKKGYQHWRFCNVWYSNTPLQIENKSLSKAAIDTIYYDEIRMDPFSQPNDSNLVWYGSGDVDSNNVQDWNDHNLIQQGIQNDQADINGDGIPGTQADAELFSKYLNGDTLLPQINWSWPIVSKEQRKAWLEKMLAIDKTDTITYTPDFQCGSFSMQTMINFRGFGEVKEDTAFLDEIDKARKYDFSNNGRFNLPVDYVALTDPNHAINSCLIGNKPLNWDDEYFLEPQDDKEIQIGDWNMSENANVEIYNSFFYYETYFEKIMFAQLPFIEFQLTEGNPELVGYREGKVILERPYVNSVKPENPSLLEKYVLKQNYPNPFNSSTKIEYSLPFDDKVTLNIYNLKGNLVETLVNEKQRQGEYTIPLNASNLSSGIYLYRIETSAGIETKKMSVLK